MMKTTSISRGICVFASVVVVWLIAYFPTHQSIIAEWSEAGSYSHGWLAVLLVAWLFVREPSALYLPESRHWSATLLGVAGLFSAGVLWWAGAIANILLAQQISVYIGLVCAVLLIWGWPLFRAKFLEFLILALAIPVWAPVSEMLRSWTTTMSAKFLDFIGVPTYVEGSQLSVPGGKFVVAEGCSGLSFFLAAIILTIVFGKLNSLRVRTTFALAAIAAAIAILSNWARVIIIVGVGSSTKMDHWIVRDHLWFGWIIFMVVISIFIFLCQRWFDAPVSGATKRAVETGGKRFKIADVAVTATSIVLLLLFPVLEHTWSEGGIDDHYGYQPPADAGPQVSLVDARHAPNWGPQFTGASSEHLATYRIDGRRVGLYIANYARETQGAELIFFSNTLYEESSWNPVATEQIELEGDVDSGNASLLLLRNQRLSRIIAFTYIVAGRTYSSPARAKLAQVLAHMRGTDGASIIAVMTESEHRDAAASDQLAQRALASLLPATIATYNRP